MEVIFEIHWDAVFKKFTVENLLKNILRENKVLEFLKYKSMGLALSLNFPVAQVKSNGSTGCPLKSPTVVLRIENMLFFYNLVLKTVEDMVRAEVRLGPGRTQQEQTKASSEREFYKSMYKRMAKTCDYMHRMTQSGPPPEESLGLNLISIKVAVNLFNLKLFYKNLSEFRSSDSKHEQPQTDKQSGPNEVQMAEGVQLVVENAQVDFVFRKQRVG